MRESNDFGRSCRLTLILLKSPSAPIAVIGDCRLLGLGKKN